MPLIESEFSQQYWLIKKISHSNRIFFFPLKYFNSKCIFNRSIERQFFFFSLTLYIFIYFFSNFILNWINLQNKTPERLLNVIVIIIMTIIVRCRSWIENGVRGFRGSQVTANARWMHSSEGQGGDMAFFFWMESDWMATSPVAAWINSLNK